LFGPYLISAVAFWGIALAGAFYWTRRYVRAVERQAAAQEQIAALEARLRALESPRPDGAARVEQGEELRQVGDRGRPL
jgi:hypothetical protein